MAYQPPYGYGGGSYGGNYPQYGQNQASNREAMLRALAQPDNANYQYPSGQLHNVSTQTGTGSALTDTAVKTGLGVAPIGVATEFAGAALKPKGQEATASPYADLTDPYKRRLEGGGEGIAGGAVKWGGRGAQAGAVLGGPVGAGIGAGVGALAGAIGGAFTKNAKSAYSDFRTQDAVEAIKKMYQTRGGRLPTEQEVEQILIGQGMDARDAAQHTGFVGEKGLYSVLHSLDQNFAKERQHLVDQATGGGGTGAEPVAQTLGGVQPPYAYGGAAQERGTTDVNLTPQQRTQVLQGAAAQGSRGGTFPTGQSPNTPQGQVPPGAAPSGIPQNQAPPQAPAGAAESAATPAPPAPPAPPALPANADTDGYAAPAYTAAAASAAPPPGWDAKKWGDQSHQTPKYVVGRIMSQFAPTTENMPKVLAEIQKAYPGTTLIGKDSINIPGVGKTDILRGADVGGKGWQWLGEHAQQGGGTAAGGAGTSGAGYNAAGDVSGSSDVIARIIANLGQLSGGQGAGGGPMTARDALLGQLGI